MSGIPITHSIQVAETKGAVTAERTLRSEQILEEMTFEDMLRSFVETHTGGTDWQEHNWPPGTSRGVLRRALNAQDTLPGWRLVLSLLDQLGARKGLIPAFHAAYERAKLYRPWSETVRIDQDADGASTLVINNTGTIYLQPERRVPQRPAARAEPVIPDAPGFSLKPDPFSAQSVAELEELARQFWRWAGEPSSREVAKRSQKTFSHATIAKFLYDRPGQPVLKMHYLLGLIRGCGGDAEEQQRWVTAWRLLQQQASTAPHGARTLRSVASEPGSPSALAARAG
ncbi:hypothetical protein [Nonomuraea sp. 10N515B]|uniref:hypothetical protein n=1 Tax=Nonomuraea sp. 10N515B TaxID=3457422 RepID=UPI003FCCF9A0